MGMCISFAVVTILDGVGSLYSICHHHCCPVTLISSGVCACDNVSSARPVRKLTSINANIVRTVTATAAFTTLEARFSRDGSGDKSASSSAAVR